MMRVPHPCDPADEYVHGVTQAGRAAPVVHLVGPVDLRRELHEARESARVAELGARWLQTISSRDAERIAEDAIERAAIVAEASGAVGGLVSVPTTCPRLESHHSDALAMDRTRDLRAARRAFEPDKRKARIAGLRRAVGFSARAIGAALDRPGFRAPYVAMLTLTYRCVEDWRPEHITACLHTIRKWLARRRVRLHYVWVAELQKRGALHYHVALWLPPGVTILKADQAGWWPHGATNIEEARKAVPYLLKYLSKGMDTAGFPKGARIHGSGGMEHALKRSRRWLGLPGFVRARADVFDDWRRARGGGWADPEGTVVPSEYVRAYVGGWCLVKVADYGRPFEAHGPFTWLHRGPQH